MTLARLANELDETLRQLTELVDGVTAALVTLADTERAPAEARATAIALIVTALQGHDRIEQRCRGLALAVRQLVEAGGAGDAVWRALALDELRLPVRPQASSGDADLF